MTAEVGEPVTWPEIVGQWASLEWDFHALLNVDLADALPVRTFRWFRVRVAGILSHPDALTARYFQKQEAPNG